MAAKSLHVYAVTPPVFEVGDTVRPTEKAVLSASGLGRVESRSWMEFRDQEGYWRYSVRWPNQGVSSSATDGLRLADRFRVPLTVKGPGLSVQFTSYTTATVEHVIEIALAKIGILGSEPKSWLLRTEEGKQLVHLLGEATQSGEVVTVLSLEPARRDFHVNDEFRYLCGTKVGKFRSELANLADLSQALLDEGLVAPQRRSVLGTAIARANEALSRTEPAESLDNGMGD